MTPQQSPAGATGSVESTGQAEAPDSGAPLLSVTRGNPTPEELAAVTAVVLALQGGAEAAPRGAGTRLWTRRARLNVPPQPGAGAWRRSAK